MSPNAGRTLVKSCSPASVTATLRGWPSTVTAVTVAREVLAKK
jgi:hypothetical protein